MSPPVLCYLICKANCRIIVSIYCKSASSACDTGVTTACYKNLLAVPAAAGRVALAIILELLAILELLVILELLMALELLELLMKAPF
jgi:hypothetical protein